MIPSGLEMALLMAGMNIAFLVLEVIHVVLVLGTDRILSQALEGMILSDPKSSKGDVCGAGVLKSEVSSVCIGKSRRSRLI